MAGKEHKHLTSPDSHHAFVSWCAVIVLGLTAVGQAFQPDAKSPRRPNAQPVRLESLTYVHAKPPGADASGSPKKAKPKFELKDGDRVVFLGNTLIERAQKYGYWETMLTARYPNRKIIFRNLGWDGDTVWAESRGIFDTPAKGYARMLAHVGRIKPTVLFLGYGNNEAFAGKAGLPRFIKQYNKLLDDLTRVSAKGVRFVLLTPTRHERLTRLAPDPKSYNESVALYAREIQRIARSRGARFIDFVKPMMSRLGLGSNTPWTSNGIHFSTTGYVTLACVLQESLKQETADVSIHITVGVDRSFRVESKEAKIALSTKSKTIAFRSMSRTLPTNCLNRQVTVSGLPTGLYYSLKIDGVEITTRYTGVNKPKVTQCGTWRAPVYIEKGPEFKQFEKLRRAVIAKNRLYFHSWRPQNITYLFLFRKHEQGQNAKEVEQFRKLVAAKEKEIDRLKKPVTRTYELIRVKPKKP